MRRTPRSRRRRRSRGASAWDRDPAGEVVRVLAVVEQRPTDEPLPAHRRSRFGIATLEAAIRRAGIVAAFRRSADDLRIRAAIRLRGAARGAIAARNLDPERRLEAERARRAAVRRRRARRSDGELRWRAGIDGRARRADGSIRCWRGRIAAARDEDQAREKSESHEAIVRSVRLGDAKIQLTRHAAARATNRDDPKSRRRCGDVLFHTHAGAARDARLTGRMRLDHGCAGDDERTIRRATGLERCQFQSRFRGLHGTSLERATLCPSAHFFLRHCGEEYQAVVVRCAMKAKTYTTKTTARVS